MNVKKLFKKWYTGRLCAIYRKQYAYKLKVNHIANVPCEGEQKWGGVLEELGS